MKIMKKILSGIMALTMVSLALCVSAAAKTMDNGQHLYYSEIKKTEYKGENASVLFDDNTYQLVFGPFDNSEMKEINNILNKGHKVVFLSNYAYGPKENQTICIFLGKEDIGASAFGSSGNIEISYIELDYEWVDVEGGKEFRTYLISSTDIALRKDVGQILSGIAATDEKYNMYAIKSGNNSMAWCYALNDPAMQPKEKDISSLSISKISNKSYTGKAVKPAVTIKDGDKKLVKGTDYTVSYKNNTKIGTASVTIKGKGNYTGEKTLTFKIVPAKTTLKVSKKSDTKATFSWTAVKGAEKYQLYYSVDGGKTYNKYTTISGSKTSYTASKLNFKKYDYKFKLRAYDKVDKTTYYGSYSKIVSVK